MRQAPPCVGDSLKGIGVRVVFFQFAVRFCSISGGILSLKRIVLAPNEARVARLGRYFLPDQPLHVIQHGNNRQAIFFCEDDHRRLRAWLAEAAAAHHCARYAAESQIAPATVNGSPAQAAHLCFLSSDAAPPPNSLLPSGASYANASTCSGATGGRHRVGDCRPSILLPPRWGHSRSAITTGKALWSQASPRPQPGELSTAFRLSEASTAASTARWRP